MPSKPPRQNALSKDRIVAAAIEILDGGGESALTFRALAARLATGSGAIYWHVADKDALLAATTDAIVARIMTALPHELAPRDAIRALALELFDAIRALALELFDAIDAHPWVGAQLYRAPWSDAMLQIFEGVGGRLPALGVAETALFDVGSALVNYILGVAGQNAANARLVAPGTDRAAFLASIAAQWAALDADRYPFVRRVAAQLRDHDDRAQFLAGIDLILAGSEASSETQ